MVAKTTNYTPKVIFCEFAEIPNASTNAGNIAVVTDKSNATFISDGISWNAFAAKLNAARTALVDPITGLDISLGGGSGGVTNSPEASSRALTSTDDGKNLQPTTTGLVFTLPAGLSPAPTVFFTPPSAGSFTVTATGGVKINGVTNNTVTRSSSNGIVALTPTGTANEYVLSGV